MLLLSNHRVSRRFHVVQLALIVCTGAALLFTGMTGELHPINGKHVTTNQALSVTDQQHLGEQAGHTLPHLGDKGGQCGEMRLAVTRHGDEQHVLAAGTFHFATADDTEAVG